MLWVSSVFLRHVFSSLYHQHLYSHTFSTMVPLCHPVTLFCTVACSTYPPPCPATSIPSHPSPPPPCTAWGGVRVRTCRLPLIWVSAIQFSGRCKPAQYHTPPQPPPPHFPHLSWARDVSATPHGAKGTNTQTPPTPPVPLYCTESLNFSLGN